jgi:2-keto-3-deoxy-6-phosphogluconate aldolase
MQIITPPGAAEHVTVTEVDQYATLSYQGAELVIPVLPRPGNYSETIYLSDGALQFVPGAAPIIAAVFACHAGETTLTLFPLPAAGEQQGA